VRHFGHDRLWLWLWLWLWRMLDHFG